MKEIKELKDKIDNFDRVKLAQLPTPLQELNNLSSRLGGPKIYMKREDLTGLAFGGNKTRMMEFRMPPALESNADIIVTGFGVQSNHARQIVAAARKFGLDTYLIARLTRENEEIKVQGNLLIDLLCGAKVEIVDANLEEQIQLIKEKAKELKSSGRSPYITGYDDEELSAISYANCGIELQDQIVKKNIDPNYLFVASEGATQAGLLLFSKYIQASWNLIGINPVDWVESPLKRISNIANEAARTLSIKERIKPDMINNLGAYVGDAYGKPTPECLEAIRLVAETEGILLDPVYSGKAMAGLIDKIRRRKLDDKDTVVFIHTGGFPSLFCHKDAFEFGNQLEIDRSI